MSRRLEGEVAVVTGSSGLGLGTEVARMFAAEGASVVVTGRGADRGEAVVRQINEAGGTAAFFGADLANGDDCAALVDAAVDRFGTLTVLVNSALSSEAVAQDGPIDAMTDDLWDTTIGVNATSAMRLCRAAIPHMLRAGHGSIVMVSSRALLRSQPNLSAYIASKGAMLGIARSIAIDYGRQGIRCNTVFPGFIDMKERDADADVDEARAAALQNHLGRIPTVTDLAYAILFLASKESSVINAAELALDSGGSAVRGLVAG